MRERKGGEDNYQRPSFEPEFSFAWLVVLCLLLPSPFLPPKKKNENERCRWLSGFHSFFWWQGDVGCLWEIASAFGCPYLIRSNFIKTTYDISLDSWISFLPLGFSPTRAKREKSRNREINVVLSFVRFARFLFFYSLIFSSNFSSW